MRWWWHSEACQPASRFISGVAGRLEREKRMREEEKTRQLFRHRPHFLTASGALEEKRRCRDHFRCLFSYCCARRVFLSWFKDLPQVAGRMDHSTRHLRPDQPCCPSSAKIFGESQFLLLIRCAPWAHFRDKDTRILRSLKRIGSLTALAFYPFQRSDEVPTWAAVSSCLVANNIQDICFSFFLPPILKVDWLDFLQLVAGDERTRKLSPEMRE